MNYQQQKQLLAKAKMASANLADRITTALQTGQYNVAAGYLSIVRDAQGSIKKEEKNGKN